MSIEVKVPRLAESISEATLVEWLKADGASVRSDEPIATLETDKAAVEIVADSAGVLTHARKPGEVVKVGDVLGRIAEGAVAAGAAPVAGATPVAESPVTALPAAATPRTPQPPSLSPAVRRVVEERGLDPAAIPATGPGGRILKDDAQRFVPAAAGAPPVSPPAAASGAPPVAPSAAPAFAASSPDDEQVVPLSRIRLRIAERLVQAQHTAAILTTFNEVDMSRVMDVRAKHKDVFEKTHGVKLGFMSFFARACVLAFADVPAVNAEIRGTDLVYHRSVHLGIAASTERGLVVPVVRDAHRLDFAGLEREIARMAQRAREGVLTPQELSGGTFTITNGGVFGSLLSTPILNPPQSGILGMHKIEKRPIAVGDDVVVRPMMYVALSYDHRVIDGQQAVTFLVKVKERLEDPERMLLAV